MLLFLNISLSENKFEQLADNGKFIEEDEEEEDDDFIASLRDIPQVNRWNILKGKCCT